MVFKVQFVELRFKKNKNIRYYKFFLNQKKYYIDNILDNGY